MGKRDRVTYEEKVKEKKHLHKKTVYVLEFMFKDLLVEDKKNIRNIVTNSKVAVPDVSQAVVHKLLDGESSYHLYDIRKSVIEYKKLTKEQKRKAKNYKNIFLGKNVCILETNASNNISDDMNQGKNRFFLKFFLLKS